MGGYMDKNLLISELRHQAEELLRLKATGPHESRTVEDTQRLIHELDVHQIELEMQNAELRQARDEVEKLHAKLVEHAIMLEEANIDLEAFNHRVSHDLYSPLTAIIGYSQLIQSHNCSFTDKICAGYLQEICNGVLRMKQLIETMLNFSHVSRADIQREKIDLSSMAEDVVQELKMAVPDREVLFRIASDISAAGDAAMMRIVLDNLLGNAWKYTINRKDTVIEFGMTDFEEKLVYFVRDNGPGFDMVYADKLFHSFQRVPGIGIKGHGIGLATVERIVKRHGGRVWGESEPDRATTFWFTMG
jgi:light-regulated signal transduction histidine kinase (bacteriophytochrome)